MKLKNKMSNKNMSPFKRFMDIYISSHNSDVSNTSLPPKTGKWAIPKENYETFMESYAESVESGNTMYITELHTVASPVLIDLDFKFNIDCGKNRVYTHETITSIVSIYNNVLRQYFSVDEEQLDAYIFEKPIPTKQNGYIKDGIHIMYPNLVSKPDIQYEIRDIVIQEVKKSKTFDNLKNINSVEDIIDEAVIKKSGWLMYGSTKENREPYELTKVLNVDCEEKLLPSLSIMEKVKKFSIRRAEKDCTKLLIEPSRRRKFSHKETVITPSNSAEDLSEYDRSDSGIAENLVFMLAADRADDRNSWLDVGICLYNIDNSLCSIWDIFSKKSSKYKSGECQRQWNSFSSYTQKLTIASLHHWAKIDDPVQYQQFRSTQTSNYLFSALDAQHFDIAHLVYQIYKYQYICSSIKFNMWYEFKNHRWHEMEKGKGIRNLLSTTVSLEFKKLESYYKRKSLDNPEDPALLDKTKVCDKLAKRLKDSKFKDSVMKECEYLFDDEKFASVLDSNINLVGFNNGVYDLSSMEFRDGRYDDYVSYTTNMDYVEYDSEDENTKDMTDFITKVLPDEDVRQYVLKMLSTILSGKTDEQVFPIWTGNGSNGKSKLMDLVEDTFGDYAQKLPVTVLTQKRAGSSSANPEIAKCKGKRIVTFQEPEKDDKINVGYMKELTGGDTIMAREMYKAPLEFKPQFKMILACNDLPDIPSTDGGTWRRIRVVEFPSKFVDVPDPNNPNEFQKDISIPAKLKFWKKNFMSLLLNMYKQYLKEGLVPPDKVMVHTNKYKDKGDVFKKYCEDNLEPCHDKNRKHLGIKVLYESYRQWHTECFNTKPPSRTLFREYMDATYGEPSKRRGYEGINLKEIRNEEEEDYY